MDSCVEGSYLIRPLVALLPAWFRFAQCLRRYRDTREAFPHLANAAKYSTSFFVVIFSSLSFVTGNLACSNAFTCALIIHLTEFCHNNFQVLIWVVQTIPIFICGLLHQLYHLAMLTHGTLKWIGVCSKQNPVKINF